jgi:hypothetical protein
VSLDEQQIELKRQILRENPPPLDSAQNAGCHWQYEMQEQDKALL